MQKSSDHNLQGQGMYEVNLFSFMCTYLIFVTKLLSHVLKFNSNIASRET